MACTCEDALAALADHLGLPLGFDEDTCAFNIGGQPFSVSRRDEPRTLVLAALVADDLPESPGRKLVCDLLDLGFGMLGKGLPFAARDPETGFLSVFALFPCETLVAAELPDDFDKFAAFAMAVAERIDAESAGAADAPRDARAEGRPAALPMDGYIQV